MFTTLLRQAPLFSKLPQPEIELLANALVEKSFPARSIIFREGDHGGQFYLVVEGQISILRGLDTPDEVVLNQRGQGEFIGEVSLFSQDGLRTATVRAETEVRALEISRTVFENLLSRHPDLVYELLSMLSKRLLDANNNTVRSLLIKNAQLERAYTELKVAQAQIIEKEITDHDLRQAREMQQNMLPEVLPHLAGYDLAARMIPARMIGGDFFDVIPLDEDHLGLAIGDVAGKGVQAALLMSQTCGLLRSEACLHSSPIQVLELLNQHLLAMNSRGTFVTVVYGVLCLSSRQFHYVRAGHEIPMVWQADGVLIPPLESVGQPLGLFKTPELDSQVINLPPGSTLLLYTDGLTEAQNSKRDFFGMECLQMFVPELLNLFARDLCNQLVDLLNDYYDNEPHSDDLTLLALKTLP